MVSTEELKEALKDNLTPEAIATIAAYLQTVQIANQSVDREVAWFNNLLVDMLGTEEYNKLKEELDL